MLADNSGSIELFMAANSLFTGKSETENSGIIDLDKMCIRDRGTVG